MKVGTEDGGTERFVIVFLRVLSDTIRTVITRFVMNDAIDQYVTKRTISLNRLGNYIRLVCRKSIKRLQQRQ